MNLSDIQHQISERASAFLNKGTHELFIDGQWVAARSGQRLSTVNPATEAVIAEVAAPARPTWTWPCAPPTARCTRGPGAACAPWSASG
jgi:hypothetical protein